MKIFNIPYIQPLAPTASLNLFSTSNKKSLEFNIKNILKEAYKSTFIYGESGEDGEQMAENFALTAAGPLADTIDEYIQKYIKSQMIQIIPKTLIAGPVPVTGSISTASGDVIII